MGQWTWAWSWAKLEREELWHGNSRGEHSHDARRRKLQDISSKDIGEEKITGAVKSQSSNRVETACKRALRAVGRISKNQRLAQIVADRHEEVAKAIKCQVAKIKIRRGRCCEDARGAVRRIFPNLGRFALEIHSRVEIARAVKGQPKTLEAGRRGECARLPDIGSDFVDSDQWIRGNTRATTKTLPD